MQNSLSIIIPVFNGADILPAMIQSIVKNSTELTYQLKEVIVVDDGSAFKGYRRFFKKNKTSNLNFSMKLLEHEKNLGKGAAIKTGMAVAKGSHIMFLDVDQSTEWESVKKLLEFSFENPEYAVCASRAMQKSIIEVKQPKWRLVLGKIGGKIVHTLFNIPIKDTQCGCKIFPRKAVDIFLREGHVNRWAVDIEWIKKCIKYKIPLKEFPVAWKDSKKSQVKPWHYITTAIEVLVILIRK